MTERASQRQSIQWTLLGQILFLLFVAFLLFTIVRSKPWIKVGTIKWKYEEKYELLGGGNYIDWVKVSPDRTRELVEIPSLKYGGNVTRIIDFRTKKLLFTLDEGEYDSAFLSDNSCITYSWEFEDPIKSYLFERRYPEWWWGHFYRPEVWATIIFGSLWLWRVVVWFRERRRVRVAAPSPDKDQPGG